MMGTVLSKEHKHNKTAEKKAVAKAEKINNERFLVTKKDSIEPIEEPHIFVDNIDLQISEASYSNYLSSETSKATAKVEGSA